MCFTEVQYVPLSARTQERNPGSTTPRTVGNPLGRPRASPFLTEPCRTAITADPRLRVVGVGRARRGHAANTSRVHQVRAVGLHAVYVPLP